MKFKDDTPEHLIGYTYKRQTHGLEPMDYSATSFWVVTLIVAVICFLMIVIFL